MSNLDIGRNVIHMIQDGAKKSYDTGRKKVTLIMRLEIKKSGFKTGIQLN